jgi:hypothetical protein
LELAPRTRRRLIAGGILLAFLALYFLGRSLRRDRIEGHAFDIPPTDHPIVVEVLNGSGRDGLGRLGTRLLRRQGFDVVYFGTLEDTTLDSTLVLVRRGDPDNGARVRSALGVGRVRTRTDTLRRVDVSVWLGPDFRVDESGRP